MSINIVEAIQSRLTEDSVSKVAGSTGEAPSKARTAMSAGAFAMVAGLIRRGSTREGAAGILSNLKGTSPGIGLLGDRTDDLSDNIVQSSGVSRRSATSILSALGPLTAGILGKEVISRNLDAGGLSSLLLGQKRALLAHPSLPSGIANMLSTVGGPGVVDERYGAIHRDVSVVNSPHLREHVATTAVKRRSPWGTILGALALGALLLAGFLFFAARKPEVAAPEVPRAEAPVVRTPEMPVVPSPELPKEEVPNPAPPTAETPGQTTITSGEVEKTGAVDGITEHFAGNGPLPESFTLPKANFVFASTTMIEGGDASVTSLAEALKAHPTARIRLEGHTDQVGNDDVNAPLSFNRADAIKKKLVEQGVDAGRIETIGLRDKKPVAANDSKEGRQENRRVDVVLLSR